MAESNSNCIRSESKSSWTRDLTTSVVAVSVCATVVAVSSMGTGVPISFGMTLGTGGISIIYETFSKEKPMEK